MREPRESLDVTTSASSSSVEKSALQRYLQEIENIPVLTPSEERELALRARHGTPRPRRNWCGATCASSSPWARQYARHGVPLKT